MGKKGLERHQRKFQAKQQVASKFKQNNYFTNTADPKAVEKLINKVTK